jgi:hypothetical protein
MYWGIFFYEDLDKPLLLRWSSPEPNGQHSCEPGALTRLKTFITRL